MSTTMETTPVPGVFSRAETRTEVDLGGTFPPVVSFEEHLDALQNWSPVTAAVYTGTLVDIVGNVQEVQDAFQGRIQAKV